MWAFVNAWGDGDPAKQHRRPSATVNNLEQAMNSSSAVKVIDPQHNLVNTAGRVVSAGQYELEGRLLVDVLMDQTGKVETLSVDQVQLLSI